MTAELTEANELLFAVDEATIIDEARAEEVGVAPLGIALLEEGGVARADDELLAAEDEARLGLVETAREDWTELLTLSVADELFAGEETAAVEDTGLAREDWTELCALSVTDELFAVEEAAAVGDAGLAREDALELLTLSVADELFAAEEAAAVEDTGLAREDALELLALSVADMPWLELFEADETTSLDEKLTMMDELTACELAAEAEDSALDEEAREVAETERATVEEATPETRTLADDDTPDGFPASLPSRGMAYAVNIKLAVR